MKKQQKRELLSKLKEISQLEPKQRFSQKVFRHLRSNNPSNDASFQLDHHLTEMSTPNAYDALISPIQRDTQNEGVSPRQINQSSFNNTGINASFKKSPQDSCRDHSDQGQYLSFRLNSSERIPRMSRMKPDYVSSQNLSTMTDFYNRFEEKMKEKCSECIKWKILRDDKLEAMEKQIKTLKEQLDNYKYKYETLKKGVEPYINNVELMSVILESLTEKGRPECQEEGPTSRVDPQVQSQRNEMKQTARVNMWLLKQGMQKDKTFNNQKYRLKCEIDMLAGENLELKRQIKEKEEKVKEVESRLKNLDKDHPLRERLQMCGQELYVFKLRYHQTLRQNDNLNLKIEEMKYKLNVLTSLIGCAIIFDVHEKENDKKHLKEIINKIDKYQNITNSRIDNNVFQYLKILKAEDTLAGDKKERTSQRGRISKRKEARESKAITKQEQKQILRRLYYPNYLMLLGEQSICARLEHIVIKPTLFIKIRSILDSKYIDYRLYSCEASKFSEFCNSHIRSYEIHEAEKKPYFITRNLSENEIKEANVELIRCLMDQRIEDIPEVEVFRDMLLGKYQEDEIYFYLMCRHKFLEGSELENFINSGDPSKFIKFDKVKRIVIKITEKFGRNIQNFICHHLNQRKIVKGTLEFTRLYYLLKLLLLVYRKIRTKKFFEMKDLFDQILSTTTKDKITFMQFYELLRKNFDFLSRTEICSMYQQTVAIFQSQHSHNSDAPFFECFAATCGPRLFLLEMAKFDHKLGIDCEEEEEMINCKNDSSLAQCPVRETTTKYKLTHHKQGTSNLTSSQFSSEAKGGKKGDFNIVNELWPDSVHILGNQRLTRQYYQLGKANSSKVKSKLDILQFLLSVAMGHLVKQDIHLYCKQELHSLLNDGIFNMIQYLNKLENGRLEHENQINSASRKIGKFFKNKIYQFYHEMLEDIDKITTAGDKKSTHLKSLHRKEISALKTEKMI